MIEKASMDNSFVPKNIPALNSIISKSVILTNAILDLKVFLLPTTRVGKFRTTCCQCRQPD